MKKLFFLSTVAILATALQAQLPTVGTSSVQFSYCTTLFDTIKPDNQCIGKTYVWRGKNITATGLYNDTTQDTYGCDSIHTLNVVFASCLPEGALPGLFSVSSTVKVRFSQGNLQYRAADANPNTLTHTTREGAKQGIWRFAEKQYHWVGGTTGGNAYGNVSQDAVKSTNHQPTSTYTGWIDLFCWGNTGASYNSNFVNPWWYGEQNQTSTNYYSGSNAPMGKNNYDWGHYNAISNGGNETEKWRVLSQTEWDYVLNSRPNATYKDKSRAWATIDGVKGLILFPDDWVDASGNRTAKFPSGVTIQDCSVKGYATNTITADVWDNTLAPAGAVFLPQTGYRSKTGVLTEPTNMYYWSSSSNVYNSYLVECYGTGFSITSNTRTNASAVRLVQNYVAQ